MKIGIHKKILYATDIKHDFEYQFLFIALCSLRGEECFEES